MAALLLDHYLTIAQAADRLGITPSAVRNYLAEGRIERVYINKKAVLIPVYSVNNFQRRKAGRKPSIRKTNIKENNY